MRLYVIGPVSGTADLNRPAFRAAQRRLEDAGYQALVPHDFVAADATWQQAMRRSLEALVKAHGVARLPGAGGSYGARIEADVAERIGLPVMAVEEWLDPALAGEAAALAGEVKLCPRCGRDLPLSMFGRSSRSPGGRQSYCRDCMAEYKHDNAMGNERTGGTDDGKQR